MKINKEIRQLSREMLRASFTDGQLDPWQNCVAGRFAYREKTASLHRRAKKLQTSASARIGKAAGQNRDSERSGFRDDVRSSLPI